MPHFARAPAVPHVLRVVLCVLLMLAPSLTAEAQSAGSVSVPVGRIGDHIEYEGTFEAGGTDPIETYHVKWSFGFVVDIAAPQATLDRGAMERQALREVFRWTEPAEDVDRRGILNVDLATRDGLRLDFEGSSQLTTGELVGRLSLFPDPFEILQPLTSYGTDIHNRSLYAFQGRSFAPGEALVSDAARVFACPGIPEEVGVPTLAGSSSVEPGATAGAVVVRDHVVLVEPDGTGTATTNRTRRSFLDQANPYPVRQVVEEEARGLDWNHSLRIELRQTAFTYGTDPIPWTNAPFECPPVVNPRVERGDAKQRFPTDGTASPIDYRMLEAKKNVEADVTLVLFRQWLAQHPTATFVGASWNDEVNGRTDPALQWNLVYSDGARSFSIGSRLVGGVAQNSEQGENTIPPMRYPPPLPINPMTISAVHDMWEKLVPAGRPGPNRFWWGQQHDTRPPGLPAQSRYAGAPRNMGMLYQEASPEGAVGPDGLPPSTDHTRVRVNLTSGYLLEFATDDIDFVLPPPFEGLAGGLPPPADPSPPADGSSSFVVPLAAASVVAVGLVALAYPLLKYLLGQGLSVIPGYAKITGAQVNEHAARADLLARIRSNAGVSESDLFRGTGLGWSTIVYHLRILERAQQISSLVLGRHKRFFPREGVAWTDRPKIAVLQNSKTSRIFEAIRAEPGIPQRRLALLLGVTNQGTVWHLRRLESTGLIRREHRGRRSNYFATGAGPLANA